MSREVLTAAATLREALRGLDADVYSGSDAACLADELAATEKACAGARLLVSARAVDAGAFRDRGFGNGAAWLARQSGTTASQSRQALQTARQLGSCPDTRAALLDGRISLAQAAEITQAEADAPGAEAALLPNASRSDLSRLREQARDHVQANTEVRDLHKRQGEAQFFRHWRDRLGMVCFAGALPPETGLPLIRRIEVAAQRSRRAALSQAGSPRETFEVCAAKALVGIAAGDRSSKRSDRAELVIVCDINAWRRGHPHDREVCHIIDGGPIPVEVAKELSRDAFVSALLHDGTRIGTIKRFGRHLPAELRTALDLGPVPEFTGRQCVDCGQRWGLEYDHDNPVANRGTTSYDNLKPRCWDDHRAKTERDRQAGLLGPNPP